MDSSFIKSSNCEEKFQALLIRFLSGASGVMNAGHLQRMFKAEYEAGIEFKNNFEVKDLREVISKELGLKDMAITNLSSLFGQASLNLEEGDVLSIECPSCSEAGNRNIRLKVDKKTIWLNASLKYKRRGYRLVEDVSPFGSDLNRQSVEEAAAFDDGKNPVFHDIEKIRFFRPNRPLSKGKTLKSGDLIPKTLVKFNQSVEVLLKGENISLKTRATSQQSGKYGQKIKVYNPKTKKTLLGKVVDFNTVMVEL